MQAFGSYGNRTEIDFEKPDQNLFLITGNTGSGKSTLTQHLNGLLKATSGDILYNGESIYREGYSMKELRSHVGLVFQYPEHQLFEVDVFSDVCFGPMNQGKSREEAEEEAKKALLQVGFKEKNFKKSPFDLSGGQKKRVAIAGVLAMHPKVLVLDEPTAGLDPKERVRFRNLISAFSKDRIVILSTHIVSDVEFIAEEIIMMKSGQIIHFGNPQEITSEIDGQVWECTVPTAYAEKYAAAYNTSNLRNTSENQTILRIIGDRPPMENAVRVQPTLEDLYLFYFKGGCEE